MTLREATAKYLQTLEEGDEITGAKLAKIVKGSPLTLRRYLTDLDTDRLYRLPPGATRQRAAAVAMQTMAGIKLRHVGTGLYRVVEKTEPRRPEVTETTPARPRGRPSSNGAAASWKLIGYTLEGEPIWTDSKGRAFKGVPL